MPRRRQFLALAGTALTAGVAGCLSNAEGSLDPGETVGLEPVADGFAAPLDVADPPGNDRLYVADQAGQVSAVGPGGTSRFLDLTDRMVSVGGGYSEQGLLGIAFHPGFADNDRFFVRYSAPRRSGTPNDYSHTEVLSEFRADTPDRAAPDSERTLLEIPQPQSNHNAGAIVFGPDGYLYVAVGDGGAGGDRGLGHVDDWYDAVEGGNGQDVTQNLLGSILRIDVDARDAGAYGIPSDNPLVGAEGLDEQYAWGFRNPWRMSFSDGDLYVADVGQNQYEEVSIVEAGGNYGWNVHEGTHCYASDSCPDETPDGEPLRPPIIEYPHERGGRQVGIAVIGGYRYRGDAVDTLRGAYVFGDWSASFSRPRGSLFAARPTGEGGLWDVSELQVAGDEAFSRFVLGFGRDRAGELYVCTSGRGGVSGATGVVSRIVPADGGGTGEPTSQTDGETGTTDTGLTDTTGGGSSGSQPTSNQDRTPSGQPQPGFGALAGIAGAGGGYALARWVRERR